MPTVLIPFSYYLEKSMGYSRDSSTKMSNAFDRNVELYDQNASVPPFLTF